MPNKLSEENSPYLLQHKDNPVNWYPWGAEALEKSKNEDKPIFLSIGYAACHWCHVMEHESFEDEDTAAIMNEHFINIKVDREERPDIDGIYMDAVVAMTGQGGWPMSVFLTTETKPFFAGTYFPPVNRYNMPAFKEVLLGASRAWQEDREKVIKSSEQITSHIKVENIAASGNDSLNIRTGMEASAIIAQSYDWDHGGWGAPPKFPQAMIIRYLLRRASRKDPMSSDMAVHALTEMAKGGMYDVLGGGFSRYSVDDQWLVPHFEKMLYDNALLARVYLHAFLITGNLYFKKICEETLDFVIREMRHPEGGFYSSLDADSEGEEGKFYVWDFNELQNLIEDKNDWELFRQAYDINPDGNFEGKIVLQRIQDDAELAKNLDLTEIEIQENLSGIHKNLFSERDKRVRPGTDDKILTSWNAWMLISFCEAARYLKREDYLQVAIENGNFLKENLFDGKVLLRSWREGKAKHNAYLEDYSSLALAYLSLYQSDPDTKWFQEANKLMEEILSHFYDPEDGFFDTREDHEKLLIRPKDLQDNATPSGSSLAVESLLQMAAYTGNGEWYDIAVTILSGMQSYMSKHPTGFGNWLCAYDMATNQINEIAIIGIKDDPKSELMINEVWKNYYPNNIVAISPADIPDNKQPPLLANKGLIGGKPSAYVCQNFVCKNPVTTPEELSSQLKSIS